MANESNSDDTISLEDLVRKDGGGGATVAGAPIPAAPEAIEEEPPAESPEPPPALASELDAAKIDDLLAIEDPAFAASMEELKSQDMGSDAEVDIDPIDIETAISDPSSGEGGTQSEAPRGFVGRIKRFIERLIEDALGLGGRLKAALVYLPKEGIPAAIASLKSGLSSFMRLKIASKLLVLAIVVLAVALVLVVRMTFKGNYLPDMQEEFLSGFQEVADGIYEYDPRDPMEGFQNPLLHPETVVLLDKLVVNLKQPGDGTNPMGMFEFYVETASKEAAIELKDREVEAKDVIARTLEQMPYEELVTEAGKHKLKIIMRKNLNEFLTKGRVRKVFFKNLVLKP